MPELTRHTIIRSHGLATPQGADAATTWASLLRGEVLHARAGLVPIERDPSISRVSQLAIHAANEAVAAGGWTREVFASPRTAIIAATSKGPIEDWIELINAAAGHRRGGQASNMQGGVDPMMKPRTSAPRPNATTFGLHSIAADLARTFRHGYGPRLTLAAACASGLHALIRAHQLIQTNVCDRALVVAAESSTSELFQATFHRLGVLADPAVGCQPFDERRHGFLLSESSAAVCLEASEVESRYVRIGAGAMFSDATHITGTDPSGRSFRDALRAVRPLDQSVDLVHAHGTGTPMNDPVELAAIADVCGDVERPPVVYSHKHAIGHTQGAAGLISVVINVLAHTHGVVPPNANTRRSIAGDGELSARTRLTEHVARRAVHESIALAAGFGGPVSAIRLQSCG